MILKEVPLWERPREKALKEGINALSTAELLAIILRTGVKEQSVLSLSYQILNRLETIKELNEITVDELCKIKGIGPTKAITLLASIELGLRILKSERERIVYNSPEVVFNDLKDELRHLQQEQLIVLYLNVKGELITKKILFVGTLNYLVIDPKEIFKWAYKHSAIAMILVHNHPSGDPTPSKQDLEMTVNVVKQARTLGFMILDHIIIGRTFYSIKNETNIL